jgi:hypothetical protein
MIRKRGETVAVACRVVQSQRRKDAVPMVRESQLGEDVAETTLAGSSSLPRRHSGRDRTGNNGTTELQRLAGEKHLCS